MNKYVLTLSIEVLADSKDDAVQKGFNIAKNERKKYDNNCRLDQVERLDGLMSTNIEFKKQ